MSDTSEQDIESLYHELLFAVASKYPDETRHQTALRYIRQSEEGLISKNELREFVQFWKRELENQWAMRNFTGFVAANDARFARLESLLGDTAKEAP